MPNVVKDRFYQQLRMRFGKEKGLPNSQSLIEVNSGAARIYLRYSKIHKRSSTFFGLRAQDLRELEALPSFICFLWPDQEEPLFVPYSEFEEVFSSVMPAADGQYKTQIYLNDDTTEMKIGNSGRFNVHRFFGWNQVEESLGAIDATTIPKLNHSQVQTLLGAIGRRKGYDVWVPQSDRHSLDWTITARFVLIDSLPSKFEQIMHILQEIDILWLVRGSTELNNLFEVEHSTPIYSGLLRFNDYHLIQTQTTTPSYSVVANETRRSVFARQLSRPTFKTSGLIKGCSFLQYEDVYAWHARLFGDVTAARIV